MQDGFGGIDRHARLRGFIRNNGSSLTVAAFCFQHEAVVVALGHPQLVVIVVDMQANPGRFAEIKGCSLHLPHPSVQVLLGIESGYPVTVHPQGLVGYLLSEKS